METPAENKKLVLENADGEVVRRFFWNSEQAKVIRRLDNKRVEVRKDTRAYDLDKIEYKLLGEIKRSELSNKPFAVAGFGHLRLVENIESTSVNVEEQDESSAPWWFSLGMISVCALAFVWGLYQVPTETEELIEELKQHVVKIVKRKPVPKKKVTASHFGRKTTKTEMKPVKKSVRRMGALGVLGRLNKSRQRGGVNLGAMNTTAGPGLGGTAGSGGVQTSLYGKGLVAAPVGAGANMQGAGGYGTKGKGGGKDGYGKLSLIGSSGSSSIPLGQEAVIQGGLDRGTINAVIMKNMGQVRFCYEQGLQSDPKLAGRVAVKFVINSGGIVRTAGVASTSLQSKLVESCILRRLKSWKFPLPEGGAEVSVSYPFILRRVGRG